MPKTRRIGAHLSTAGGVDKAIERAHAIGANVLQVFSGSPRQWQRTPLDRIDAKKVQVAQEKLDVTPIFTHVLYLVNLASDNLELVQKSVNALKHDLNFDAHIGGAGLVVHLGSHHGRGFEAIKEQVAKRIKEILSDTPSSANFLIENAASRNGKLGGDLAEIKWLLDAVDSPRLGWCFDTCHGFAAGYSLGSKGEMSILAEMKKLSLFGKLWCLHVNDSKDPASSNRDRHENIGDGQIPKADLHDFLNDQRLVNLPIITEAPGLDGNGPDAENILRLKSLVK
jgi:deoxyribonuclease-4